MRPWQLLLSTAQSQAQAASFTEMLATCQRLIDSYSDQADALLDVGTLLYKSSA